MKTHLSITLLSLFFFLTACGVPKAQSPSDIESQEQDFPSIPGEDTPQPSQPPITEPSPSEPSPSEPPTSPPVVEYPDVAPFPEDSRKFNRAWSRQDTVIVIDAYQGNPIDWDEMATDRRVAGVIHRATIGSQVDTKYKSRQSIAEQRGYLWGAYHLGRPGDPIGQAKLYLKTIGNPANVLMILDLENTSSGSFMNASEAKVFMKYVFEQTGKVPVIYANHSVTKSLNQVFKNDELFLSSRLWYARFRSSIPDFPYGVWPTYFLWQFSSEINCNTTGTCLYNVPGTKFDMDVNVFYGNEDALKYEWYR